MATAKKVAKKAAKKTAKPTFDLGRIRRLVAAADALKAEGKTPEQIAEAMPKLRAQIGRDAVAQRKG